MTPEIEEIHHYWFGELDDYGMCAPSYQSLWFKGNAETDRECRRRFAHLVERALAGDLDHWADQDPGLVALVILLDQFTRTIYRGTAAAFSGDQRALDLAQRAIASGHHQRLPAIHKVFLYMPLEHCEDLEVQEECVTLFEELAAITGNQQIAGFTRYAIAHREVIKKFWRFPHRNAIVDRQSTAAELAHLEQHGGF